MARRLGKLVHLQAVHLALRGEEQHVGVRGCHEQVLHVVVVLEVHARHALAAALLLAVGGHGQALHVAGLRHRDDHALLGDEILDVEVLRRLGQERAARAAELLLHLEQLFLDDLVHQLVVGEHALVVRDPLQQLFQLVLDLLMLQAGEAAQAHLEDGGGLLVRQGEALGHALGSFLVGLRRADDVDDLVDVVQRDDQAFEDMRALLGLRQLVARTADDDLFLVRDVVVQHLLQRQHARRAVHQRQHDHAEAHLQLRVLVQLVQHHLRNGVLLEVDDDIDAVAVGAVVDVADLGQLLLAHQLAQLFQQALAVHLVGDLGDHDGAAAVLALFHLALRAHGQRAAARLVRVADALLAHDYAASGEVRAGQRLHQLFGGDVGVVQHEARGVDGLAQVVRRDVRGHAHGDALRAVHQQVGEARGKNRGLFEALVVVGLEVDRFLVQVAQQLHGHLVQTGLGVTHGRRAVAVDGAEVAVAVHQRHAHRERLGQAHHRVVHGGVAVRVVLADDVADRTGRFHVRAVRRVAGLVHGVQDAAVNRLQAVAHVRQGARDDDAHGVFQERRLHLLAEVGGAHDGALAAVGAFDDGAVRVRDRRHVDQRARLVLLGHERAGARLVLAALDVVQHVVFVAGLGRFDIARVVILFGAIQELVERIVVVCHKSPTLQVGVVSQRGIPAVVRPPER